MDTFEFDIPHPDCMEEAVSGRSLCRCCKKKIPKGSMRMTYRVYPPGSYPVTKNYCLSCVFKILEATRKQMTKDLDSLRNGVIKHAPLEYLASFSKKRRK